MSANDGGAQTKSGVLFAILFFVVMFAASIWMLASGPSETSVFFFLRSPVLYYPLTLIALVGSVWLIWLGIKRYRSLP